MGMLDCADNNEDSLEAFAQTDPDMGSGDGTRAASLRAAFHSTEDVNMLIAHLQGTLRVAPSATAEDPAT